MKLKVMPFLAGVLTLAFVAAPLAAQACSGTKREANTPDSNFPQQTQTSVTVEGNSFTS
ncbi:MAG: hypothetical protein QNJ70_10640 [Xenococcaceae cyanobacterium MO_207.B15]|nr:hypothetical protein [Xenococcaceae cyanobacterium MO_207.B15]